MTPIEIILKSLEGNAGEFKRLCEAKVCSSDLRQDINKALSHGGKLSADIDMVMAHLLNLKIRLEKSEESP